VPRSRRGGGINLSVTTPALRRAIIFTRDLAGMKRSYRDVIGLSVIETSKG
jgi:hypothetical protein